jgi:serine/threonine protein kinase
VSLRRSIGPYELVRVLDTGGMGKVYLAKDRQRGRKAKYVVVKTIRSELEQAPEHVSAFQRETRILARLQHPNIVQLYDAGRAGERLYMVMEYLEGLDVAKMLRLLVPSRGKVPLGLVVRVGIEAARALHAAHAYTNDSGKLAGLVHRDLSPHNVFVLYDGRVKLLDFGLARAYSESAATTDGMVKGKFRYLAPEQARGEELDGRVDIFTLGLVLHEMITGCRAYDQTGDVEVLRAAMQGQFVRLSAIAPDTPAPLLRVVDRAVRGPRGERYPSAAAMADDLVLAAKELGLPTGPSDHLEFLREMRALADASPLAAPIEPSARLSTTNVRSSLTSVADIESGPGANAPPKQTSRRLALWAGGLGAVVGALAAIANLAGSGGAAGGGAASALVSGDASPAEPSVDRAPPVEAPAERAAAIGAPAERAPSGDTAAERAPSDTTAEPAPAADAPAERAAALPADAPAELAAAPVVPAENVVAAPIKAAEARPVPTIKKAVVTPKPSFAQAAVVPKPGAAQAVAASKPSAASKPGAAQAAVTSKPGAAQVVVAPKPAAQTGAQFSGHAASHKGGSPQPERRATTKHLPSNLSRDRR